MRINFNHIIIQAARQNIHHSSQTLQTTILKIIKVVWIFAPKIKLK